MYGGFEQVGSIGSTLPSADTRITTNPGDIVLYSSNQIVLFYDSNTWSYTKLGHINLSKSELKLFVNYLESALKASIVTVRYAGNPSQTTKDKIKKKSTALCSVLCDDLNGK